MVPTNTPTKPPAKPKAKCSIEGCPRTARAAKLCERHYQRVRRTGKAGPATALQRAKEAPLCVECRERKAHCKKRCRRCYDRLQRQTAMAMFETGVGNDGTDYAKSVHLSKRKVAAVNAIAIAGMLSVPMMREIRRQLQAEARERKPVRRT